MASNDLIMKGLTDKQVKNYLDRIMYLSPTPQRFVATIAARDKRIEGLEKFKEAVLSVGIEIVEVCMGCGRENCGDCPAGVTLTAKNVKATAQTATIERLRGVLRFYADERNYYFRGKAYQDMGEQARNALDGKE